MVTRRERLLKKGLNYYANSPENEAASVVGELGAESTKRGYPDLTVYNSDGSIYGFIEVKPHKEHDLKPTQKLFQDLCTKHSIPFIRWSPDNGREVIEEFMQGRL